MKEKSVKFIAGVITLFVVIIGGFLAYSFFTSPEAKLANAIGNLTNEDQIQVDTDFTMSLDFDGHPSEFGLYGEEEVYFNILKDIFQNIEGENSVVVDFENHVVELGGSYGISGDIHGEDVHLQVPFRLYLDEDADEIALDLDPYTEFLSDFIDVLSYNILPNIPEIEEELALFTEGEDVGDFLSTELNTAVVPVVEESIKGAKYKDSLDLDERIFIENDDEDYLFHFVIDHMIDYFKDNNDGDLVTEEDGWIILDLDEDLIFHSYLYALNEVKDNEEAKEAFEKDSDIDIETAIADLEEEVDTLEDGTLIMEVAFMIESGNITASNADMTMTFEEEGVEFNITATASSTYKYNEDVEFVLYGAERKELTEADLDMMFYDIELEVESHMEQYIDEFEEYYEYELTEEELELFEAIEAEEVSHEDFGLTEEEMYWWVLDLEYEGFVEPGTSSLYEN
ncbi:hypothetical protein [Evansella halocellulosilytica]|uniref:hypothetical protein n=1 Tax=Evansella halocellulosilytica TaxID=2011013 RepID=UPI000BB6F3A2|nr:hypothetical protein [Evansella halocellulosilytica]